MTRTETPTHDDVRRLRMKRRRPEISALLLLPVVLLVAIVVWRSVAAPKLSGDSRGIVSGSGAALECLRSARFTRCDHNGNVGYRALLQYLPAMGLREAGLSPGATLRVLIGLNAASFVATIGIAWITAVRIQRVWAPVLVAVLLMSPLQWYATDAFTEALAAAVILAAIASVLLQGRPAVISVLVALACLGKETNFPFVLALAALCLLATPPSFRRRGGLAVAVGGLIGVLATVGFDYFRYGSLLSKVEYLPVYRVPNHAIEAKFFASLWLAPNGGIAEFWPAALLVLGLTAVAAGAPWRRPGNLGWRSRAGWAVWVLLGIEVAGLSTWYSPFGWTDWGPRLALPMFPAMLVVAALVSGPHSAELLERLLRSFRVGPIAITLAVVALPQYAISWHQHALTRFFTGPDPVCTGAHVETNAPKYYRCIVHLAWGRSPLLWHGLGGLRTQGGAFAGVCLIASVLGLTALARQMAGRSMAARD